MTRTGSARPPPPSPRPRGASLFARGQFFALVAILALVGLAVAGANTLFSNAGVQRRLANLLYERTGTRIAATGLGFRLVPGVIEGLGLELVSERTGLYLGLDDFEVRFNPLFFLLGRIKVNAVTARKVTLDTSRLTRAEKRPPRKNAPDFLRHIRLRSAAVGEFYWNQGSKGWLTADDLRIESKFGSLLYKSPTELKAQSVRYVGPKVHVFADRIAQDGFFILDLSRPGIIDDARVLSRIEAHNILIALSKRKKPWLTTEGWDKELGPVISARYEGRLPDDRSYLSVARFGMDFEKNRDVYLLRGIEARLKEASLRGQGHFNRRTGIGSLKIETTDPLPFSRLPLGQARLRQAFETFTVGLDVKGTAQDLDRNRLRTKLTARFSGNVNRPEAGDLDLSLEGEIRDAVLGVERLELRLLDGRITGKGSLDIKEGTVSLALSCDDFDVHTVVRLFSSVVIPSVADCDGALSGKLSNPRLSIRLTSPDAGYEFLHFGPTAGTLGIENDVLELDIASSGSRAGTSSLDMRIMHVFDTFNQTMELHSRHASVDARELLRAQSLDGAISGTFDLDRKAQVVTAKGDFTVRDFRFFGAKVGELAAKLELRSRRLTLLPLTIRLHRPAVNLASARGLVFDFDDGGYRISGELFRELAVKGDFKKSDRSRIRLEILADELPLKYLSMIAPADPKGSIASGRFDLDYRIYDPIASQMRGEMKKLLLDLPETQVVLVKPAGLDYASKAFRFRNFTIRAGAGEVTLDGGLGLAANSDLRIAGRADLNVVADYNPVVAEADAPLDVDVTLREELFRPKVYGKAVLRGQTLTLRGFPADFSSVTGTIAFDGLRVATTELNFLYDDAPVRVKGWVANDYEKVTGADLLLTGSEVPIHLPNGLDLESDLDLALRGSGAMRLTGKVTILDGRYHKEFGLNQFVFKPRDDEELDGEEAAAEALPGNTVLDLAIRSTGDLTMESNVADLEMKADLKLLGTLSNPAFEGQIDILGGRINALGVSFEDASGYAQFDRRHTLVPDVSLTAKRDIQEYEIQAHILGMLDNLRLRFDSIPSLDRRDIMSVLFYGQTPDRLVGERRQEFIQAAAASTLASVFAGPIHKIAGLDVVEVNSRQEGSKQTVQRLSVGRSLSNRFNLLFTTDLGIEDPERAFELEYQIFDRFYLIVAKDVGDRDRYRLEASYRLQAY